MGNCFGSDPGPDDNVDVVSIIVELIGFEAMRFFDIITQIGIFHFIAINR